jgi:hypothetical protein
MAQGNESLCLLVFNLFGILCVCYSCQSLYYLHYDYYGLPQQDQELCGPYVVWKLMFLLHIIIFFMGLSFAVGTCDTFLNDEDLEITQANELPERKDFTNIVAQSLEVLKTHCMIFCGPCIFVECVLQCVYYNAIINDCQPFIEDPMTSTLIYIIIVMGCISTFTTAYCAYMSCILVRAFRHALPSMRNSELWQAERMRQRNVRQQRLQIGRQR